MDLLPGTTRGPAAPPAPDVLEHVNVVDMPPLALQLPGALAHYLSLDEARDSQECMHRFEVVSRYAERLGGADSAMIQAALLRSEPLCGQLLRVVGIPRLKQLVNPQTCSSSNRPFEDVLRSVHLALGHEVFGVLEHRFWMPQSNGFSHILQLLADNLSTEAFRGVLHRRTMAGLDRVALLKLCEKALDVALASQVLEKWSRPSLDVLKFIGETFPLAFMEPFPSSGAFLLNELVKTPHCNLEMLEFVASMNPAGALDPPFNVIEEFFRSRDIRQMDARDLDGLADIYACCWRRLIENLSRSFELFLRTEGHHELLVRLAKMGAPFDPPGAFPMLVCSSHLRCIPPHKSNRRDDGVIEVAFPSQPSGGNAIVTFTFRLLGGTVEIGFTNSYWLHFYPLDHTWKEGDVCHVRCCDSGTQMMVSRNNLDVWTAVLKLSPTWWLIPVLRLHKGSRVSLWTLGSWTRDSHLKFPISFRRTVFNLLLCFRRVVSTRIPSDVLGLIVNMLFSANESHEWGNVDGCKVVKGK